MSTSDESIFGYGIDIEVIFNADNEIDFVGFWQLRGTGNGQRDY